MIRQWKKKMELEVLEKGKRQEEAETTSGYMCSSDVFPDGTED